MKTEELITLLARSEPAVDFRSVLSRYGLAAGWAAFFATLFMAVTLGVRADLALAIRDPMLWFKVAFSATLMSAGALASLRLAQPGRAVGQVKWLMIVPLAVLWISAISALVLAEPDMRPALIFGQTWTRCPWLIAALSLPGLVAFTWAMKGLAPTHLRLAGGAVGLLSGGLAATVYCLHCPESTAAFIGIWYVIGIFLPVAAGMWLGPRVLRW